MDEDVEMTGVEETETEKTAAEPKPGYKKNPFGGPDIQCSPQTNYVPEPIAEWESRLLGKKLTRSWESKPATTDSDDTQYYLEADLPKPCRVIADGHGYTFDYEEQRLNVELDRDGKVYSVHYG